LSYGDLAVSLHLDGEHRFTGILMSNENEPQHIPTAPYDEAAIDRARAALDALPEQIGPYRVLERIGVGGMGDVFRAQQRTPIRREVAIKSIKLGMDSRTVIARFEAERQALALMDHPHIAKVLDAGTDESGRPYFVMEYVKGKPLTEYADQSKLTIRERLELFEQVCHAIQHAHHKGVIHRDLKPSNVLVSTEDGKPFAKVIDFGIAKAVSQQLTDKTLFTRHDQFIGTPQYMSPEQAEGSIDVDTRTDVYSLGVLLYELLTGTPPFSTADLKAAAFEQFKKLIIEVDPPSPSARLSQSTSALPTLAAVRGVEPRRLGPIVRGELDWIVMKALEKDRKRRYETPAGLADDVRAHVDGEVVKAAPPSWGYRLKRLVRRRKGQFAALCAVSLTMVVGLIATSVQIARAQVSEARVARAERELAANAKSLQETAEEIFAQQQDLLSGDEWHTAFSQGSYRVYVSRENGKLHMRSGFVDNASASPVKEDVLGSNVVLRPIESLPDPLRARMDVMRFFQEQTSGLLTRSIEARRELIAERDRAERHWCSGLLRPFGDSAESLSGAEQIAFEEWSSQTDPRLRLLPLEVALSDPDLAFRVVVRAKYLIQASVGLSPTRRKQVLALTSSKQRDLSADPRIRAAACWLSLELGTDDLPALEESLRFLSRPDQLAQLVRRDSTSVHRARLFIEDVCRRTNAKQLTAAGRLAPAFIDFVSTWRDTSLWFSSIEALTTLAPQMTPADVTISWGALVAQLNDETAGDSSDLIVEALLALAPRLTRSEVRAAWGALVQTPNDEEGEYVLEAKGKVLMALARRLTESEATSAGDHLISVLKSTEQRKNHGAAAHGIRAVATRLPESRLLPVRDSILVMLRAADEPTNRLAALGALTTLASRMEMTDVDPVWEAAIEVLKTDSDDKAIKSAHSLLATLAPQLDHSKVTPTWEAIVPTLFVIPPNWPAKPRSAALALRELAPRLERSKVNDVWDDLLVVKEADVVWVPTPGEVTPIFAALAQRLDQPKVGAAWHGLIEKLEADESLRPVGEVGQVEAILIGSALTALATRLDQSQVHPAWDDLVKVLSDQNLSSPSLANLADETLKVLAPRLEQSQIRPAWDQLVVMLNSGNDYVGQALTELSRSIQQSLCNDAADALCEIVRKTTSWNCRTAALKALATLVSRMENDQIKRTGDALIATVTAETAAGSSASPLNSLVEALAVVAPRLDYAAVRFSAHVWFDRMSEPCPFLDSVPPRVLVELMSHPRVFERDRSDEILKRFEELVLYEGRRVFPRDDDQETTAPASPDPPSRQFHRFHDAADWIANNWPDLDLESSVNTQRSFEVFQ
jgi:serine/threonine protein kinase